VARAPRSTRYEVIAVRYGTRLTAKSDVFLHFARYGEPDEEIRMDYFFWVARNADRTVLIDCGFNERSGASRGRTMLCPPPAALQRIGIAPEDISLLVATHAHYDHIGNLDAFPAATVIVSAREYSFWTSELASRPLFAGVTEADDISSLRRAAQAGRVSFIYGPIHRAATHSGSAAPRYSREPIAAGIEVVEVGGHTPGQLIVLLEGTDGTVVIASDALHYYDQMELDRPFVHVADLPAMYAGLQYLRDLQAAGARIVAGHDPDVGRRFPSLADRGAGQGPGELDGLAVQVSPAVGGGP
jgi:glyoxylase-like metal-dependent hydrolase (beta-lactamase superfamily II)